MVIDALTALYTSGKRKFDRGGRIAATGRVNDKRARQAAAGPVLPPASAESAGREQYGQESSAAW